jgi:phosphomannomutase
MSKAGKPLSVLLEPLRRYADSGEINLRVEEKEAVIERIAKAYSDARQDRTDGLTVEYDDWWFNVRPSNTEPLLRVNVEAGTEKLLEEKTNEVLGLITGTN